jgi:UDP-N-acetylglucosamine transferase subunit ALG13
VTALPAAEAREPASPRIVVTVGTDHHPFDRLISWINDWLSRHPEQAADFFVQAGPASVQPACPGSQFLDVSQLDALLDSAEVIICHGGPGCIADAWAQGQLPIVVPRIPKLGEIVDVHQVDFCRKLAELGRIRLAQTPTEFASLLDEATRDHTRFRSSAPVADVDAAVARFGELVEELVSRSRRRRPLIDRGRRTRRRPEPGTGASADPGTLPSGFLPDGQYDLASARRASAHRPRR